MSERNPIVRSEVAKGSRHYKGAGLGRLQAWKCVACGQEQSGPFTLGCTSCGAGKPGVQTVQRKVGERGEPPAPPPAPRPAAAPQIRRPTRLADQLRSRPAAVDYDDIETRVRRALEGHLGGGYTAQERATLYNALECYIALWEDGTIEPLGGLPLELTRALAQKVAPDAGLELETGTDGHTTETAPQAGPAAGTDAEADVLGILVTDVDELPDEDRRAAGGPDYDPGDDDELPRLSEAPPE